MSSPATPAWSAGVLTGPRSVGTAARSAGDWFRDRGCGAGRRGRRRSMQSVAAAARSAGDCRWSRRRSARPARTPALHADRRCGGSVGRRLPGGPTGQRQAGEDAGAPCSPSLRRPGRWRETAGGTDGAAPGRRGRRRSMQSVATAARRRETACGTDGAAPGRRGRRRSMQSVAAAARSAGDCLADRRGSARPARTPALHAVRGYGGPGGRRLPGGTTVHRRPARTPAFHTVRRYGGPGGGRLPVEPMGQRQVGEDAGAP